VKYEVESATTPEYMTDKRMRTTDCLQGCQNQLLPPKHFVHLHTCIYMPKYHGVKGSISA
jgi:hypothetical protein